MGEELREVRAITVVVDAEDWAREFGITPEDEHGRTAAASDFTEYVDGYLRDAAAAGLGSVAGVGGKVLAGAVEDAPGVAELLAEARRVEQIRKELAAALQAPGGEELPTVPQLLNRVRDLMQVPVVHVVQRDNMDGLYGFLDEDQAAEYAGLFPGAETGTLIVNDERAGAELIAEERGELDAEAAEVAGPPAGGVFFAIDADCPGCGKPERAFDPARQVFMCSSIGGRCGYESTERDA